MGVMQRYVSKELTHFVGGNLREVEDEEQRREEQYKILLKIIEEKCISFPPHRSEKITPGAKYNAITCKHVNRRAKFSSNEMIGPDMICFCDIPIEDISIHISKYSPFGLSFQKSFLIERGANPILYVGRDSAIQGKTNSEFFDEMVEVFNKYCYNAFENPEQFIHRPNECHQIGGFMVDLLSYIKFFDSDKSDDDKENFYMEREWRSPYYIHFEIENIQRIILPNSYSKRFRDDVPEYIGQITFSDGV